MESITTTQVFEFALSDSERKALEELIRSEGCKAHFKVLKEARVEVKIQVEVQQQKEK